MDDTLDLAPLYQNGSTTDTEIEHLVKRLKIPGFRGIFTTATLPGRLPKGFYVLNLDSKGGGTHWVLLEMQNLKRGFYSSSFGDPPPEVFGRKKDVSVTWNSLDCQALNSSACGYFVVGVMLLRKMGYTYEQIWDDVFQHPKKNDRVDRKAEAQRFRNNAVLLHLFKTAMAKIT